ncbi:MAG TPA: glycosyltransferase [Aggregatilineaceae bacterium]|nr:glycosyltransferase [Aggregatilineaceae bacterium]
MSDALISIVLPTYNGAKYLEQALQSVVEQTHEKWELIVVDSYSQDATPDIVARYAGLDARIRAMQHPKESGRLPGALNAGFAQAQGIYHTWLSDDNYFRPHSLSTMADYLDQHRDIGVVYTDFTCVDAEGKFLRKTPARSPSLLMEKNVITPSFLYRREVHETLGGYRVEYFLSEDYDFWLRARSVARVQPLHEDCHVYRVHDQSLTAGYTADIAHASELALLDCIKHSTWMSRNDKARAYVFMSRLARKQDARDRQRQYWIKAAQLSPYLIVRRGLLAGMSRILGQGSSRRISRIYVGIKRRLGLDEQ